MKERRCALCQRAATDLTGTTLFPAPFTSVRARVATSPAVNVSQLFFSAVPATSKSTAYLLRPSLRAPIARSKRSRRTLRLRASLSGWRAGRPTVDVRVRRRRR